MSDPAPAPVPDVPRPAPAPGAAASGAPATAVDTAGLRDAAQSVSGAADALSSGLAAYESIPIETLSLALGPVGGEFLAAFDAATARHRDVLGHAARILDSSGSLMRAAADSYELVDSSGAGSLRSAGAPVAEGTMPV